MSSDEMEKVFVVVGTALVVLVAVGLVSIAVAVISAVAS